MLTKNASEIIRLYTEGEWWLVQNRWGNTVLRKPDGAMVVYKSRREFDKKKPAEVSEWPDWCGEDEVLSMTGEGGKWFPRSRENDVVALVADFMRLWKEEE